MEAVDLELPCAGKTTIMYPTARHKATDKAANDAECQTGKRLCAECPIAVQCLENAIANKEKFGIWGGVHFGFDLERRHLYKKLRNGMTAESIVRANRFELEKQRAAV